MKTFINCFQFGTWHTDAITRLKQLSSLFTTILPEQLMLVMYQSWCCWISLLLLIRLIIPRYLASYSTVLKSETATNWFQSYIINRTHSFYASSDSVGPVLLSCSVPQGFVLRPLKCIAYTDDVTDTTESYNVGHHLSADDTHLQKQMTLKDLVAIRCRIEKCVTDISDWCSSKGLHCNVMTHDRRSWWQILVTGALQKDYTAMSWPMTDVLGDRY